MIQPQHNVEDTLPATVGSAGVTVVGRTHQGMIRTQNEDTFGAFMSLGLFVVCDGMGGHAGGEIASDLALRTVFHSMFESKMALGESKEPSIRYLRNSLTGAIHRAHHAIREQVQEKPQLEGMGTTFAALQVNEQGMILSHVGDSRIYRWSERRGLVQLTRDHSLLNQLSEHRNLRVCTIETGSEWVQPLLKKFEKTYKMQRHAFAEDPIEVFARQVWVSPYYEDDLHDLKAKVGADHMLFGSDWPHAEGLRNPVDFVADLDGFDSAEVEQIMRTNGLALAARAV